MGVLKNTWVIGIITGIVSGLLVFFVTNFFFDNKRKREYALHIKEANTDLINVLKPYIAEQGLPDNEVLVSLILSTSRKYSVDEKDLFSPVQICEELIREVIGDVYVTSEKKKEYTEDISNYKKLIVQKVKKPQEVSGKDTRMRNTALEKYSLYRRIISVVMIVGFIGLTITLLLLINNPKMAEYIWYFPFSNKEHENFRADFLTTFILFIITAMFTAIFLMSISVSQIRENENMRLNKKKHYVINKVKQSKEFIDKGKNLESSRHQKNE